MELSFRHLMHTFWSLLIILITLKQASSIAVAAGTTQKEHNEKCRLTAEDRDSGRKNTPCAFPFKFDGISYDGICTSKTDPNGEFWCSTKTDKFGRHTPGGGHWGYCRKGCGKKPKQQTRTIKEGREQCKMTLSDSGSKRNTPCSFPFKFNGKLYDGVCSNAGDPDGKFWCSTKTRKRGRRKNQHWQGGSHWGYCQPGCDIVPTKVKAQRPTPSPTKPTTRPTKRRKGQVETDCDGLYCDEKFWEINSDKDLKQLESKEDNWLEPEIAGTEAGDYLPNEFDQTCGETTKTSYIVGGEDTKIGEFPFIAALGYRIRNRMWYSCGATLINRRYVLSAAHCHEKGKEDGQIAEVVIGDYDLKTNPDCIKDFNGNLQCTNKPVQKFPVTPDDVITHENWAPARVVDGANDIVLVRLSKVAYTIFQIASGVHVVPICLPWGRLPNGNVAKYPVNIKDSNEKDSNEYIVMGWGRTNNNKFDSGDRFEGGAHSNVLQKLEVPFIPIGKCKTDYKAFNNITSDKQVCAGGLRGKDSCQGDSGGPLMVRSGEEGTMYLQGIVSFGTNKCGKGYPGVYTNVEYYIPWIKKQLKP